MPENQLADLRRRLKDLQREIDEIGRREVPSGVAFLATSQTFTALQTFSNGINLGNENLTVYDEGTFTPVIADAAAGGNTATGSFTGRHVKIGPIVFVWMALRDIVTTGMTGANDLHIRNLPFTAVNISNFFMPGAALTAHVAISGGLTLAPLVIPNTTGLVLFETIAGSNFAAITVSDLTTGFADIYLQTTYLST